MTQLADSGIEATNPLMGGFKRTLRFSLGCAVMVAGLVAVYHESDRQDRPEAQAFARYRTESDEESTIPRIRRRESTVFPEGIDGVSVGHRHRGHVVLVSDPPSGETASRTFPFSEEVDVLEDVTSPVTVLFDETTTVPPSVSSPTASQDSSSDSPTPAPTLGRSPAALLQRGEELILEGMYASAFRVLGAISLEGTPDFIAQVRFRIGLCSELSGDMATAQAHYEAVHQTHRHHAVGQQAFLGLTRLWNASGRRRLSSAALYRQIIRREFSGTSANEDAWHLLGLSLAGQTSSRSKDIFDDRVLFTAEPLVRVPEIFAALGTETSSVPVSQQERQMVDVLERLGPTPDAIRLRVLLVGKPLRDVVRSFGTAAGWEVEFSEKATARLLGRTITFDVDNRDMAFLLDAAFAEHNLVWRLEGTTLHVQENSEVSFEVWEQFQIRRAAHVLQQAIEQSPRHRWGCHSYVALGRLAVLANRPTDAVRIYEQADERFAGGECRAELWTNHAKLLLLTNRRDESLQMFYRVVDSFDAHPLNASCYLYIGRLQLENGEFNKAIPSLMRALSLLEKSPNELCAANLLASALLLDNNPLGANAVLMKRRLLLADSPLRDQSAMVAALARYHAAVEPERKRHEAISLAESLAHVNPAQMFGGHWWYLVVDGLQQIGLTQEAHRVREECLRNTQLFPLRERLLVDAIQENVRSLSSSPHLERTLQGFAGSEVATVRNEVRLLDARTAYENGLSDAALERCRALVQDSSVSNEVRRQALQMMGKIYQLRDDHTSAIYCFSGMLPPAEISVDQLGATPPPVAAPVSQ